MTSPPSQAPPTVSTPSKPRITSRLLATDPESAEPSKPKILLFGLPGVGKTWGAMDFPSVYYIDTEAGGDLKHYTAKLKASGGMYMGPDKGSQDFDVILNQIKALATEPHGFRTLVIDSISKVYNCAINNEAERLGDKDAFGASKKPAIAQMRRLVAWASRIDMNVIFIAHEKAEWGIDMRGERTQTGVTFDAWDKLEYELHLVLHIVKRGSSRIAIVRKSRLEGFPDKAEMPWSYAEFAGRYGQDVIEAQSHKMELATKDQLDNVARLLEVVRITEDEQAKWLHKANVTAFSEMEATTIEKIIKYLKGKVTS